MADRTTEAQVMVLCPWDDTGTSHTGVDHTTSAKRDKVSPRVATKLITTLAKYVRRPGPTVAPCGTCFRYGAIVTEVLLLLTANYAEPRSAHHHLRHLLLCRPRNLIIESPTSFGTTFCFSVCLQFHS